MERTVIDAFSVPLIKTSLPEVLKNIDLRYVKNIKKRNSSGYLNINCSQSDQVLDDPKLSELKDAISNEIDMAARGALGLKGQNSLKISCSWTNYAEKGKGHTKHIHRNSVISGVFFIDVEKSVPWIKFDNPLPSWYGEWEREFYNPINGFGYDLPVSNGDLVFFPSWLVHYVPVNTTNHTRITLSFDTILKGPLKNEVGTHLTDL